MRLSMANFVTQEANEINAAYHVRSQLSWPFDLHKAMLYAGALYCEREINSKFPTRGTKWNYTEADQTISGVGSLE